MQNRPEISIIITAYNKGMYIGKTIRSVLKQSFQDFEIIIVDNGSTDNTREVISDFSDKRIRYFFQEHSGGPACTRNRAMSLANGEYFAFLDGDDSWQPEKLARCVKVLRDNPHIGLVCHHQAVLYNAKLAGVRLCGPDSENLYEGLLLKGICIPMSSVVIRSSIFFNENLKFSEEAKYATVEDYEYWLRLSRKHRFYFLREILGNYLVCDNGELLKEPELNARNMLGLIDCHFSGPLNADKNKYRKFKKRRSSVICASARIYLHKNNFGKSREWYIKAFKEYPFNYKAIFGIITSLLKIRIIYR